MAGGRNIAKFEGDRESHRVYELSRPQGHGMIDQKHGKGNLSPIRGQVPMIDHGATPGADGAGGPGMADGMYGSGPSGNA